MKFFEPIDRLRQALAAAPGVTQVLVAADGTFFFLSGRLPEGADPDRLAEYLGDHCRRRGVPEPNLAVMVLSVAGIPGGGIGYEILVRSLPRRAD